MRFGIGRPCFRAILARCGGEQGNVQMIAEPRVDTETQTLSESVLLGVIHVLFSGAD